MTKNYPRGHPLSEEKPYINGVNSKEWKSLAKKIRERDYYTCQILRTSTLDRCKHKPLDIHHINHDTYDNNKSNLITLCRIHHFRIHDLIDIIFSCEGLPGNKTQIINTIQLLLKEHCFTEANIEVFEEYCKGHINEKKIEKEFDGIIINPSFYEKPLIDFGFNRRKRK
jgi:hypothetical protein